MVKKKEYSEFNLPFVVTLIIRKYKMKEKVEAALDKIRPTLKADGGDAELVVV